MEEKNEKDNDEKITPDYLIKRLELMNRELNSINAETDDSDKNKLEYSNITSQHSQKSINSNEIQNQSKISSNLENEEINLSNSTSINSEMKNPSLNQYHPFKNLSYNPLSNNVPIPQKDIQSLPNKMIPKNIIYQKTNFSLSQSIIFPNGITKAYIISSFNDQQQTIFLQRFLMGASKEDIETIVKELLGTFRLIIKDKNGNYFCTDLFKVCEQNQRIIILEELSPFLSEDCVDNFATHPIQALIDRASTELEYKLILFSFNDYNKLLYASLEPNGAYTIQKIIERIPDRYRNEFNYIFISFVGFISKKKFGIVTVKKFISCTKTDTVTSQLMGLIRKNFMDFAEGQYANYLVQYLLEKWNNTSEGNEIKELIFINFKAMCEKKYSSFICEKFIEIITPEEKNKLIQSLDINSLIKSNNTHTIKIMKLLGIFNNNNNSSRFAFSLKNNNINFK